MGLIEFCSIPRTMAEIENEGFSRHQVYGAVKRGELVNQNRKDAWGRIRRGAGLFTVAAPAPVYDAAPLVDVWR
jgi:hypothetical protein